MKQFTRICPKCNKEIHYQSNSAMWLGNKKNSKCRSCAKKGQFQHRGKDNYFYGKHHTEETKLKLRQINLGYKHSEEAKAKISKRSAGQNNPMFGRRVYDIWVQKYGKETADEKLINYKKLQSELHTGKRNPAYGKNYHNGSGNGWKGWYKDIFFRSLRELSFLVKLMNSHHSWYNGEKIRIPYKDCLGTDRTYAPDFIINDRIMIEIKPKKLQKTPTILAKSNAATEYCKQNNMVFKIIDSLKLSTKQVKELLNSKLLVFQERYAIKFEEFCRKSDKKQSSIASRS